MMGIVFNLLERCVREAHGEDAWDDLLDRAGLDGAYTSLGKYADEQLLGLVTAASGQWQKSVDEIERWFGRAAMPLLAARYPEFFNPHQSACAFVLTLNAIIHPEVRKLYPGASVPVFEFEPCQQQLLRMRYRSARQMCAFAEGLLLGAADHYGETLHIDHPACVRRGDAHCTLVCQFGGAPA